MSDFAPAIVERTGATSATVHHGDDTSWLVKFYMREVEDPIATKRVGRPQFKTVPYIRMENPGDKLSKWDLEATEEHQARWPGAWTAFQKGEEDHIDGTPLREWAQLTMEQRTALKNMGFQTVEQVAAVSDDVISRAGHQGPVLSRVRQYAKAYIDTADQHAQERRLVEQLEERDATIAALTGQVEQLAAQMQEMQKSSPAQVAQAAPVQATAPVVEDAPEPTGVTDLSSLEDLPEVEPVTPEEPPKPAKRPRGRPRKDATA